MLRHLPSFASVSGRVTKLMDSSDAADGSLSCTIERARGIARGDCPCGSTHARRTVNNIKGKVRNKLICLAIKLRIPGQLVN